MTKVFGFGVILALMLLVIKVISNNWIMGEGALTGTWGLDYDLTYGSQPPEKDSTSLILSRDKKFIGNLLPVEMTYDNYYTTPPPPTLKVVYGDWGVYSDGAKEFILLRNIPPPIVASRLTPIRVMGAPLLLFSSREGKKYYFRNVEDVSTKAH